MNSSNKKRGWPKGKKKPPFTIESWLRSMVIDL